MNDPRHSERPAARLRRLWREGGAPDLDAFLAVAGPLAAGELAAVLRVDQSERAGYGGAVPAEDYLRRYPAVAADREAAVDLIHNEFLLDERAGRPADPMAFLSRFPAHADTLRLQFDLHRAMLPSAAGGNHVTDSLATAGAESTLSWEGEPAHLPAGERFGAYELIELIARGGMGVVYKARHLGLDRVVALKMILTGRLASAGAVDRFHTEARAAARLDHPGIVPVFEIGEHRGRHYFTMAYVEGRSLDDVLRDGPLPPTDATRLVRELCAAIAYAHDRGIVHRDLKPANVLLDGRGNPKLTDFGLAKSKFDSNEMTGTGEILGTPAYMSPEQATGGGAEIGPLTDVYGLGALLFALTTGRPPFQAATPMETIRHVLTVDPPRPRVLNPGIPRDLETICLKCLEKSPARRYAGAPALAADLDRFLTGVPIRARPVGVVEKAYRWYRRRPVVGSMAAALVLLLAAVPLLLTALWNEAETRAKAATAARVKIEAAEAERARELFESSVKEAAARRSSPKVGRRFDALDRIVAARDLADELHLPAGEYVRLRSEAMSALSLVDVRARPDAGWTTLSSPGTLRYLTVGDLYLDWDPPDGLLVRRAADHRVVHRLPVKHATDDLTDARLSPDNRFVWSLSAWTLVVWRVDGSEPTEVLHRPGVNKAWFAPDRPEIVLRMAVGDYAILPLGGGAARTVRLDEVRKRFIYFNPSALGPRGRIAIAGMKSILVVDLDLGKVASELDVPGPPDDLAWSPDGETLAVSNRDAGVVLYRPGDKSQRTVRAPLGGPVDLAFDPSGRFLLLVSKWTGRNILVDVERGVQELQFHRSEVEKTPAAPPARWCLTLDSIHRVIPLRPEDGLATTESLAVHPGGRLLATPTAKGVVLTDLGTGRRLGFLSAPGECRGARFDAAGNLFVQRGDGSRGARVFRWEVTAAGPRYTVGAPVPLGQPGVAGIDVSADGRYVAAAVFTGAVVHDRRTGRLQVADNRPDLRQVAIHPDGSLVASFTWGPPGFRVWDSGADKIVFSHPTGNEGRGRFTQDGKHLITYGFGEPALLAWPVPEFDHPRPLGPAGVFAVSPDGRYVAVTEPSGKIRLNRIPDGELIARFDAPGADYLIDLAFSPDGRHLLGMNTERTRQHVWDLWNLRDQLRELKLDWEPAAHPAAAKEGPISLVITPQSGWGSLLGPRPAK